MLVVAKRAGYASVVVMAVIILGWRVSALQAQGQPGQRESKPTVTKAQLERWMTELSN